MPGYLRPETELKIRPNQTFTDPVSKLRVSTPQTLIDTDFEYGVQSTKWETLNRVNHVPSFFARTPDTPLPNLVSVAASGTNSNLIVVTTAIPHGLVTGTPILVAQLTESNAEGTFLIKTITATTFSYETVGTIPTTANLVTPYTTIIPGEFYVGSEVDINPSTGVTTNGANPSVLTFETKLPHGFEAGTDLYLVNSTGGKSLEFDAAANYDGGTGDVDDRATIPVGGGASVSKLTTAGSTASTTITLENLTGIVVGSNLYGPALSAAGTRVTAINTGANQITVSAAQTVASGARIYFDPPINPGFVATTTTAATTDGNSITVTSTDGITVGVTLRGTGTIPASTTVTAIDQTTRVLTLSGNVTVGNGAAVRFYQPSPTESTFQLNSGPVALFAYEGRLRSTDTPLFFRESDIDVTNNIITISNHGLTQPKYTSTVTIAASASQMTGISNSTVISASSASWQVKSRVLKLGAANTNITVGENVYGTNIPPFTKVASTLGGTVVASTTGTISGVSGAGPYTATISNLVSTYDLAVGGVLTATGGTGSLGSGTVTVASIVSPTAITISSTDVISAGTITNLSITYDSTIIPLQFSTGYDITTAGSVVGVVFSDLEVGMTFNVTNGVASNYIASFATTGTAPNLTPLINTTSAHSATGSTGVTATFYRPVPLVFHMGASSTSGNVVPPGMAINTTYYAHNITTNNFQIAATANAGATGGTILDITGQGSAFHSPFQFVPLEYIRRGSTGTLADINRNKIYMQGNPFQNGDKVVHYGTNLTGITSTATNYTVKPTIYYVRNRTADEFSLSLTPTGSIVDITAVAATTEQTAFFAYVVENPVFDTIYSPNHGLQTNSRLVYRVGAGTAIGGLTAATEYNVLVVDSNHYRLATTAAPTVYLKLTSVGTGVSHGFNNPTSTNPFRDSITINNHGFVTGTTFVIYNINGNTALPGLTDQQTSWVRVLDSNRFQLFDTLANATAGSSVFTGIRDITGLSTGTHIFTDISPTGTTDGVYNLATVGSLTATANASGVVSPSVITFTPNSVVDLKDSGFNISNHRFTTGQKILYSITGGTGITGLTDDTYYYVIRTTPNYFKLATSYANALAGTHISLTYADDEGVATFTADSIFGETQGAGTLSYTYTQRTFDGSSAVVVSLGGNTITSTTHGFLTGTEVTYSAGGGTAIGGLIEGRTYFVRAVDANTIALHTSYNDAIQGQFARRVDLSSVGTGTTHTLSTATRFITGTGTQFSKQFKVGDTIVINAGETSTSFTQATPNTTNFATTGVVTSSAHGLTAANDGDPVFVSSAGTLPAGSTTNGDVFQNNRIYYFKFVSATTFLLYATSAAAINDEQQFLYRYTAGGTGTVTFTRRAFGPALVTKVAGILNDSKIDVTISPTTTFSNAVYYLPTSVYVKPNARSLHRPYDGGVDLTAGLIPDASAVRQTRRYFRYQSGKGIQASMAINFNSPINIETVTTETVSGPVYRAIVRTRYPHNLTTGLHVTMSGASDTVLNGTYQITVTGDYTFRYILNSEPDSIGTTVGGNLLCNVVSWSGASIRAGMFDDQNGFYYEYDGDTLFACRRSTTKKLSGKASATFGDRLITGVGTAFTQELDADDYIVIRGQSYKVLEVEDDETLVITPAYRGTTSSNIVITKTETEKVAQADFSIDTVDGNGPSGYNLNINKIQMIYMDYSWYGAGKIRFGIKDGEGEVIYIHEFKHNNINTQAYIRSGNLPSRYEVMNGPNPTYGPTLSHWGTSIIIDGGFDDDEAYFFSVGSDAIIVPAAGTAYPLLSVRLAPSVDSGLVGNLGDKEIINRMQMKPRKVSILSTVNASLQMVLNGKPSVQSYGFVGTPSLAQYIAHTGGTEPDTLLGGVVVAETRVAANTTSEIDLEQILPLGNSIMGGDGIYPNGPDLLTVVVTPLTANAQSTASVRMSWTESQA